MIIVAAFEAPTIVASLDDVAVMGQAVKQRGRHCCIAEDARPFAKHKIGGDDDGGALVRAADEVEQELTTRLSERQIAQFVEDDEVHAGQVFGETALPTVAGLSLESVDEVDDVVEASSGVQATGSTRSTGRRPSSMTRHGHGWHCPDWTVRAPADSQRVDSGLRISRRDRANAN